MNFGSISKEGYSGQISALRKGTLSDPCDAMGDFNFPKGGAVVEALTPNAGDAIRNRDVSDVAAANEAEIPDAGDAIRNSDACQICAASKSANPDTGGAIRNRDAPQTEAVDEGSITYFGDCRRYYNTRDIVTAGKSVISDAGDRLSFNDSGYNQRSRFFSITLKNSDCIAFYFIF
jgi:hypothetical protein